MRATNGWARSLAGVLSVWFGLVTAVPGGLHSCPPSVADGASVAAGGHRHAEPDAPPGDGQSPEAPTPCRCVGHCALATATILPVATTLAEAGPAAVAALPWLDDSQPAPITPSDHLQPFATAPPAPLG